jgi:hypothetical protein
MAACQTCLALLTLFRCGVISSNRTFELEPSHETQFATLIVIGIIHHTKGSRQLRTFSLFSHTRKILSRNFSSHREAARQLPVSWDKHDESPAGSKRERGAEKSRARPNTSDGKPTHRVRLKLLFGQRSLRWSLRYRYFP